jgi:very-short-patch-repair endonuclease
MFKQACAGCGREYCGFGAKFCSARCSGLANRNRIVFACKSCGISCERPASARIHDATEFCGRKCWYAFARGKGLTGALTRRRVEKRCAHCSITFTASPKATFCSVACQWAGRGPCPKRQVARISLKCRICSREFQRLQCQINAGRGAFCSQTCRALYSNSVQGHKRSSGIETRFFDECLALGANFTSQVRIGPYCADALSADGSTAFEFDGDYWHSLPRVVSKDKRKEAYFSSIGITVIHIPESLYKNNPEAALALVMEATSCRIN